MVEEHCLLGYFHGDINYRCLVGLWNPITVRNPENGGNMFSEMSVQTKATWYKVPEGIYN
jgi:hypothetical protein